MYFNTTGCRRAPLESTLVFQAHGLSGDGLHAPSDHIFEIVANFSGLIHKHTFFSPSPPHSRKHPQTIACLSKIHAYKRGRQQLWEFSKSITDGFTQVKVGRLTQPNPCTSGTPPVLRDPLPPYPNLDSTPSEDSGWTIVAF